MTRRTFRCKVRIPKSRAFSRAAPTWSPILTRARTRWSNGCRARRSGGWTRSTEAGQFGNAGRNIARGDGIGNLDLSLLKNFALNERMRLQFRAECFNLTNHANFGLPVNDLASPSFGRILEAGPARLIQFGLKLIF